MASKTKKPPPPLTSSPYPFAAAPDIIRAHQKDAYFQGLLTNQLSDLHRRLRGARSAHAWAAEARTAADLLYLSLTTLLGNRTLGEEYCDLVQVEAPSPSRSTTATTTTSKQPPPQYQPTGEGGPRLPSFSRRAGYIATSILLPYLFSRTLPRVRSSLRQRLQDRLTTLARQGKGSTTSAEYRLERYALTHLSSLTSGAHLQAVTLAVFYFTGAYYSLSKRLFGLRYIFTRRIDEAQGGGGGGRAGYEVLGVLLVVQILVRAYTHLRQQLSASPASASAADEETILVEAAIRERAFGPGGGGVIEVSLDENAYTSNNGLLVDTGSAGGGASQRSLAEIGTSTHTPVRKPGQPRYDLRAGDAVMGWIKGYAQRKCTLCLEELKDPAATSCGHVFCWECIGDWVREKPECPLCRREAMVQHILPLRVA
ncbi:Pex12 amino terminal region-domain-containing protein [Podospora appendiculata]|uniref:RING-type E3 ubiquitin transferase n=1 Tax=Podospora appendiculata TaxID=314037 RepID=A0AAE1CHV6_9PEZI|nr:Pex12 amino terminal region-domain-containing protein [Podospora appendiculata]